MHLRAEIGYNALIIGVESELKGIREFSRRHQLQTTLPVIHDAILVNADSQTIYIIIIYILIIYIYIYRKKRIIFEPSFW